MKIGEHMEPVIELLEELNGNDTEAKLKLLALVICLMRIPPVLKLLPEE
ncbi:TPA: hypothetical protein ACXZY1_004177 [Salmonella enterica]